ncbi:MAG: hypothetical protein HQK53_09875 [Oligoflexia bacterium]|nr:hypothetical protein [Oligoflexia bacterium]
MISSQFSQSSSVASQSSSAIPSSVISSSVIISYRRRCLNFGNNIGLTHYILF